MLEYQISRQSAHCDSISMRTEDEQTDMTKLTVAFRRFANMPKMYIGLLRVK